MRLGAWLVAIRGWYWIARGWHHTKFSLSSALVLSFFLECALGYCPFFCHFFVLALFCSVFVLSLEFVYVPLIFFLSRVKKGMKYNIENGVRNVAGHCLTISECWSMCSDFFNIYFRSITPISWKASSFHSMASDSSEVI